MLKILPLQNPWEGKALTMGHCEGSEDWGRRCSVTSHKWSRSFGGFGICKVVAFLTALFLCSFLLLYDETRWVLLQRRVGHLEKPFRISLEYVPNGNKSVAAVDSFAMKNCSSGNRDCIVSSL